MKYIKKPIIIDAIQFNDTPERLVEIQEFMDKDITVDYADNDNPKLKIETLEGIMEASIGDYIIKGIKGEFYPCKPDIFEASYNKVDSFNKD